MTTPVLPPLIVAYLTEVTQKYYNKNAKIVLKSQSKLMKLISWIVKPFNPNFLRDYITTIGSTIYVPDGFLEQDQTRVLEVIAHESIHVHDFTKNPVWFVMTYLFPQNLAILSLAAIGAIWNPWWLLCLLFLLALAPWPAPGRYLWERRAFTVSLAMGKWCYQHDDVMKEAVIKWIVGQLSASYYYYVWPFPAAIENEMLDKGIPKEQIYDDLYDFVVIHDLGH